MGRVRDKLDELLGDSSGMVLKEGKELVPKKRECDCACPIPNDQIIPIVVCIAEG